MKQWSLTLLLILTGASPALAQKPLPPAEIHDRIVAIIARRAPGIALAGDTSVTWYHGGPILYHVVHLETDSSRSLFLRNDSLVGLAKLTWDSAGPRSFSVVWLAADSVEIRVNGERVGGRLRISGSRDTAFDVPTMPWAVADIGMEENVVPAIRGLGPSTLTQLVAVYRPYPGRWDTLSMVESPGNEGSLRVIEAEGKDTVLWVIDREGALLQLIQAHSRGERRPLESTRLFAAYKRLRLMPIEPQ